MDQAPPEQHSAMLAMAAVAAGVRAGRGRRRCDHRRARGHTRLVGLRLLGMLDAAVAETHMRQLLDTTAAGHAAIWLLEHGLAADAETVGAFVTPAVMVDILSELIDHPDALCETVPRRHDPDAMLEFFWRHRAPETLAVLDALGQHLPDRALAGRPARRRCGTAAGLPMEAHSRDDAGARSGTAAWPPTSASPRPGAG